MDASGHSPVPDNSFQGLKELGGEVFWHRLVILRRDSRELLLWEGCTDSAESLPHPGEVGDPWVRLLEHLPPLLLHQRPICFYRVKEAGCRRKEENLGLVLSHQFLDGSGVVGAVIVHHHHRAADVGVSSELMEEGSHGIGVSRCRAASEGSVLPESADDDQVTARLGRHFHSNLLPRR